MSRIGKLPIEIPSTVKASVDAYTVVIEGPKGRLEKKFNPSVKLELQENQLLVSPADSSRHARAMYGTTRAIIANMVDGVQKGYSNACTSSIPICKGECCKWHFPKNLNYLDFFISIFSMTADQVEKFAKLIFNNRKNQCPILLESGCYLSFEQRPIACTNAYPCFADRSYWVEKEKKNILFKNVIEELEAIIS